VEKLIWLVWRDAADAACAEAPEAGAMRWGEDARGLVLTGYLSTWIDRVELRSPVDEALSGIGAARGCYVTVESAPIEYGAHRSWPDGTRSPGVSIVTAFDRVPGLDDESFYAGWHGSHTPLTFELHPMWQYLRHAVLRGLSVDAPRFAAIVLESCSTLDELLDPFTFFGARDRDELRANIERVNADLERFADRTTLQTTPMHEVIVRSPPWQDPPAP
jgi:hypothetical protein